MTLDLDGRIMQFWEDTEINPANPAQVLEASEIIDAQRKALRSLQAELERYRNAVIELPEGSEPMKNDVYINTAGMPEIWHKHFYIANKQHTMPWLKDYRIIQRAGRPVIYTTKVEGE